MKKIALFSFFNSYNIGDVLIAKVVSRLFSEKYQCKLCDIASGKEITLEKSDVPNFSVNDTKSLKYKILYSPVVGDMIFSLKSSSSAVPNNALESCKDADAAIFAGGNSIMNLKLFPNEINVTHATVKALKDNGKKVAYCFCGVGPFRTKKSLKIAKKTLDLIDFISVRDQASYDLVKKLCPEKDVEIWRDPVLLEEYDCVCSESKAIGVNVYFGASKGLYKKAEEGFVSLIRYLRESYSDYTIKLFSSELTDIEHIIKVKEHFETDPLVVVEQIKKTDDLFEMYKSVDVVLGTRMHTIITAMISKKAVTSISWQAKVESLIEYFENQEYSFKLEYLISKPNEVAKKLIECLEDREKIVKANQEKLISTRLDTKEKIENFTLRM